MWYFADMINIIFFLILAVSTVWDGVYTEDQATRGKQAFEKDCASCHEMAEFSGPAFMDKWAKHSAFDLYDAMRTKMPMDRPGALSKESYSDIVAYMFKANTFPAGKTDLPAEDEALKQISIEAKGR
jgi:mono/diheme cytochrome c family protein